MPPGQRRGPERPTRRPSWSRASPLTTRTVPGGRAAAASSGRGSPPMMSVREVGVDAGRSAVGRHEQVPEVARDGHAAIAAQGQQREGSRGVQGRLLARLRRAELPQVAAGHAARDDGGHADGPRPRHGLHVEARAHDEDGARRR